MARKSKSGAANSEFDKLPPMKDRAPTPSNLFSFSRIKCFRQCPLRYRYRYIQGLKETFRSIESFLGSTVHDVLEWMYLERDRGSTPDEPKILEQFAKLWSTSRDDDIAIVRIGDNEESYLKLGREMLIRFFRDTFERDQSETVALEQRLSMRLSKEVVFTGFADRIGRTDQGRLFVVDYKTSRNEGNGAEFSEGLQAPLYAACVLRDSDEDEVLAGYHYLRHGTTRWQQINGERTTLLLERFLDLANEAEAAGEFPARPGILCAWCGFNSMCPAANVPERYSGGLRHAEKSARRLF
jgi:RecB family exonuclease